MPITKQFGPSAASYGSAVYGSAQNQERFGRMMAMGQQMLNSRVAEADSKYKMGMLELEKDKWAKQWPLLEKEMDLREVETWLQKSIAYFEARATAASQRLNDRAVIYDASRASLSVGEEPTLGSKVVGPIGTSSGGIGYGVQYYNRDPAMQQQVNAAFGEPYRLWAGGVTGGPDQGKINEALSAVDSQYQSELARIDEVFGISQGWTPNLFMTGAPESWQAPASTPAYGQNPLTGTQPRNDPGASSTPIIAGQPDIQSTTPEDEQDTTRRRYTAGIYA